MSKLCSESCGPSDFYPAGRCGKNGCLDENTKMRFLVAHLAEEHGLILTESEQEEIKRIIYPELYKHADQHK